MARAGEPHGGEGLTPEPIFYEAVKPEQRAQALELLAPFLEIVPYEFSYPVESLNLIKGRAWVQTILETGVVIIASQGPKVVGSIGIAAEAMLPWADDSYLFGHWIYVVPEARKSTIAMKLIKIAKKTAEAARMPLILATTSGIDVESKGRLFRLSGFEALGVSYRYAKHLRRGVS